MYVQQHWQRAFKLITGSLSVESGFQLKYQWRCIIVGKWSIKAHISLAETNCPTGWWDSCALLKYFECRSSAGFSSGWTEIDFGRVSQTFWPRLCANPARWCWNRVAFEQIRTNIDVYRSVIFLQRVFLTVTLESIPFPYSVSRIKFKHSR